MVRFSNMFNLDFLFIYLYISFQLKEDNSVHGSDEEVDESADVGSDEELSDDSDKQVDEEVCWFALVQLLDYVEKSKRPRL